jgi:TM2 domain-containing membrane protein YozV
MQPHDLQQGMPQQGIPQQGMPQQGMPQQGMPQQGMPQQGIPQQGMPQQGMPQQGMPQGMAYGMPVSDVDWMTTLLLAILVGVLGVDHFYSGKVGTGVLKLLTLGGCGIWSLIDVIMLVTESYKDGNGLVIKKQ